MSVSDHPSVTQWISDLKGGDAEAAQRLWDRYFGRLILLARNHLGVVTHGASDQEDVAQSVFKSLCLGAERGRFPSLNDRKDLWTLLVVMSAYKSRDLIRHERRLKRGGGKVLDEAALDAGNEPIATVNEIIGRDPTPEFALEVGQQCKWLLSQLTDVERQTAERKLEGFTNQEIAAHMECGLRTVERRLASVRQIWVKLCDDQWQGEKAKDDLASDPP
jgi:DNA-directed RNA polymerase specialized sigma24 family protein